MRVGNLSNPTVPGACGIAPGAFGFPASEIVDSYNAPRNSRAGSARNRTRAAKRRAQKLCVGAKGDREIFARITGVATNAHLSADGG